MVAIIFTFTFRFFRCVFFVAVSPTPGTQVRTRYRYRMDILTHKPKQQARRSCSAIKRVGKGSLCISVDFLPKSFEKMSTFSLFKARRGKQRFSVVAKNKHAEEGEEENREEGEMIENIYY